MPTATTGSTAPSGAARSSSEGVIDLLEPVEDANSARSVRAMWARARQAHPRRARVGPA
jgi:hypothetical protein